MLSDLTESNSPLEPETVALLSMVNDVVLGAADATEPGYIRFLVGHDHSMELVAYAGCALNERQQNILKLVTEDKQSVHIVGKPGRSG